MSREVKMKDEGSRLIDDLLYEGLAGSLSGSPPPVDISLH